MASQPNPQDDGAPDSGAPRSSLFGAFTSLLNIAGTLLILAMVIAVNADIGGRNFFNKPIAGVIEFVGLAIVAIVFLQMANTLREHRHVSNDILVSLIVESRPRFAAGLYTMFYLVGGALMTTIVWFVWPIVVQNYVGGYYRGTAFVAEIPIWPFYSAVVLGAATTAVQFFLHAWHAFWRAAGYDPA
jgi:TRAP-type C4-dicarboxylate transport system permease small subunit